MLHPVLSVVMLTWNKVELTRRCVDSIRNHTHVPYELIIVDNGSLPPARDFARDAADIAVLNPDNRGFAAGMNAGLARARGEFVAFVNNDTVLPAEWDVRLIEHLRRPTTGVVTPAVTAAGNRLSVRTHPGTGVVTLPPFRAVPSGVVYLMRASVARGLGGWDERYRPAGAEDADLCFKVWVNGLDVVLDERVLVDHVSKGSATQLTDQEATWAVNRQRLLRKWRAADAGTAVLPGRDPADVAVRRRQARLVAWSMTLYFATVNRLPEAVVAVLLPALRRAVGALAGLLAWRRPVHRRSR